MRTFGRFSTAAGVLAALLFFPWQADAKPAYASKEKKVCSFCHVGKPSDATFTNAGEYYKRKQTMAGFAEATPAPSVAPAAAPVAAPAAAEAPKAEAVPAVPPAPKRQMMEAMKGRIEEMRKAVTGLRESETKLAATTDQAAFRGGVLAHLRALDDIQETHLKHMEAMMAKMPADGGMAGHHGHMDCSDCGKDCPSCCKEKCAEKPCGDCPHQH